MKAKKATKHKVKPVPPEWRGKAVHLLAEKNPKRPGTQTFTKFALLKEGMTPEEYIALESKEHDRPLDRPWAHRELQHFIDKGFIKLIKARPLVVVAVALILAGCTWADWAPPPWLDADGKVIPQVLMQPRDERHPVERYRPDIWRRMFTD